MPINQQSLGSFDPGVLAVLYQAFDDVWLQLEKTTAPDIRDTTRNAIATALIQAAMGGERDPEKLWCHAMNRARALSTLHRMTNQEPPSPALPRAGARLAPSGFRSGFDGVPILDCPTKGHLRDN
jgi:hypothetical protein